MRSAAGVIVSRVAVGLYPLAGFNPSYGKRRGMGPSNKEAAAAEHGPMDDMELYALLRLDP